MATDNGPKTLFVTGATGFLGRYVVAEALRRGHRVRALVRAGTDVTALPWSAHERLEVARGDLRRRAGLAEALAGCDTVLHLAAAKSGDLYEQLAGTVVATENLLAAMDAAGGARRIVAVSSFAVYDYARASRWRPLDERTPLEGRPERRDAYAQTKLAQERLVVAHAKGRGWAWTVLRPGVIYGAGQLWTARLGVPLGQRFWLRVGMLGRLPLTYVENCATAIVAAAETDPTDLAAGRVLNVVDDHPPTPTRYARLARRHLRPRPRVLVVPRVLGSALAGLASATNALLFRGRAKVPSLLVPARFRARFKPLRYDNRALRESLSWSPRYDLEAALARSARPEAALLTEGTAS